MVKSDKQQLQIPIMYAFREAHKARDAKVDGKTYIDGERVLSERAAMRRRGANEQQLKSNLEVDLVQLANTINMAAAVELDDLEYVKKSVLNYGMIDLSPMTTEDVRLLRLHTQLRQALLDHEPRFVDASMEVTMREEIDDVNQKIAFDINAEMACKPVDIPLEFVAEIDVGSGDVKFSNVSTN